MSDEPDFHIRRAFWQSDRDNLRFIRSEVFIHEQKIPEEKEWDDQDEQSYHVLAQDREKKVVACGRLTVDGHIGRMAVLKAHRGQGIGQTMLKILMGVARDRGYGVVALSAQKDAVSFYEAHGFRVEGDEYDEAGIPHWWMTCPLD
ncbi:MAG: GNAT family N-acetyltransferase [Gammaproteobacteria bacterium]|nr:MAG: GNAT family N-acetyltransferase [Gammaproteobacteria bacterium]